ncbi:MAG: DsbA family protein [Patescibacteria group bacterium]
MTSQNNLFIPLAIVIAGALIAGAVYLGQRGDASGVTSPTEAWQEEARLAAALENMAPVTAADHIRGSTEAPVKIVEYSDFECPFCKSFHPTMQRVMEEYGDRVAWVYRHFPLDQIHPKADKEAEATECANELGGTDAFWKYTDRLFEVTPSNNNLDPAELPRIAQYIGLATQQFNECLSSGRHAQHVEDDTQNALATGGNGTPWSIIVAADGTKYPLSGAQPYESLKQLIELALKGK